MRSIALLALPALLVAGGCGKKALVPADDPIERAATCGVVETAAARDRSGSEFSKPLSLETQGRILHYPLLAASAGKPYDAAIASAVVKRMSALADSVAGGDWRTLQPSCAAAFPAVAKTPPSLPADAMTAALGCDELATFMQTALARQTYVFDKQLDAYDRLNRALDQRVAVLLVNRGIMASPARLARRNRALAAIDELGSPVPMLKLCMARYS